MKMLLCSVLLFVFIHLYIQVNIQFHFPIVSIYPPTRSKWGNYIDLEFFYTELIIHNIT